MRLVPILIFWLFNLVTYSQALCDFRYNNVWILGAEEYDTITTDRFGGSEINFSSNPPELKSHPKSIGMSTQTTSMCSKEGELIFYSNGCSIHNVLDSLIENGDNLNPGEFSNGDCPLYGYLGVQNMISIPDPYNDSIYYIINMSLKFNPNVHSVNLIISENIYYSKINVLLNDGRGKVIDKNHIILSDTNMITTPITAVKHGNGLDWWIITPNRWDNGFKTILLDENGPHYEGDQFIGNTPHYWAEGGQGKFSPNGERFAWYHPRNGLFLYYFNRENGELFGFDHIEIPPTNFIAGGCEFSPNGRFLYISFDTSLYQLDLESNNIQESLFLIGNYDGFRDPLPTRFYLMERTPHDKIIMNVANGSQYLHVIHEPNKSGMECNFEQHALKLPTDNNFTLPHFPNYKLGPLGEEPCDSMNVKVEEITKNFDIKIVPNPAMDEIKVCSDYIRIDPDWNFNIYNLDGKLVERSNQTEIDISSLPSGLYFIRIIGDESPTRPLIFIKH